MVETGENNTISNKDGAEGPIGREYEDKELESGSMDVEDLGNVKNSSVNLQSEDKSKSSDAINSTSSSI